MMMNERQNKGRYLGWELKHLGKLVLAYFIVLPLMIVFLPAAIIGNGLGIAYNELRRW